jgi:gluconate 5-dehydrogenase
MTSLDGKTALVSDAARQPGRGVARALAAAGANVILHAPGGAAAVDEIASERCQVITLSGDLASPGGVAALAREAEQRFARIDVLVLSPPPIARRDFAGASQESWEEAVGAHLRAAFLCAQRWLPAMVEAGEGRILHIVSSDVFKPVRQRSQLVTCGAGLVGLTRALAAEFSASGVTVNAVVPGLLEEEGQRRVPARALQSMVPAGRLGRAGELGELCVFLASRAAAYITGQTIHCNGGRVMG